jgi:type IV secretion system protein VirB10
MSPRIDERSDEVTTPEPPGTIRDRRIAPRGVLPRHVQMWLMVGIAIVILAIILLTGQPQPSPRPQSGARPTEPSLVSPERVRSYEQTLAAEAARQQQALAQQQRSSPARTGTTPAGAAGGADLISDDQRRREYQSLFADNVALSRRASDRQPYAERNQFDRLAPSSATAASPELSLLQQLLKQSQPPRPAGPPSVPTAPAERPVLVPPSELPPSSHPDTPAAPKESAAIPAGGSATRLLEGTVIETVLLNRLDGTFAGPVTCLVTTPVYSHDRQSIVIPAGARVLGSSSPVQTWGDSRLAVGFHRLVMPDGRTHSLDRFKGLNQIGDAGLKDSVNRHYWQVFGASLAIGALSGLAQYGSRSSFDSYSFEDSYRQAAGSSLAASTGRVLDRYLNVLPTITIREGYRIKVYLTNDLELPLYAAATAGGVR